MFVKCKIVVLAVVTEDYKRQLTARYEQALEKVELAQRRLETQGRRYLDELEDGDTAQAAAFRKKLEQQRRRQEEIRTQLTEQLTKASSLELGTEHPYATLEGMVEIRVGDSLEEKLRSAQVVVKDGVVVDIRRGDG